jgi:hypothetical protein
MSERLGLIQAAMELHRSSIESHAVVMRHLIDAISVHPAEPQTQRIVVTGPTSASSFAPLPGTELTIYHMIPPHRRLWDHCLVTNYRFEPTSFVRAFPGCGHYFWYRHQFETENGVAICPQCDAEEHIAMSAPPSSSPPSPPRATSSELRYRRRARLLPDI